MMKKNLFSAMIPVMLLFSANIRAQKMEIYQSSWNPGSPVEKSGELTANMQSDAKSQFQVRITNDESTLYLDIIQAERAAVQKIMQFGLTTWINAEGKHKKTLGIRFPLAPEGNSDPGFKREKGGDRKNMMLAMMASRNQEMVLTGFEGKGSERSIDPRKDSLFKGVVEMLEGGRLHVSISVPLNLLGRTDPSTFTNPLGIGFETGYLDLTRSGMASGSGGGGQQGYGGGMHGGGGMYGGPGGGPPPSGGQASESGQQQQQPDISELSKPSKLWINRVTLAESPPYN